MASAGVWFYGQAADCNHRIQMRAGEGCFTITEGDAVPNRSMMVQVRIEDARRHCERARTAGATILSEPTDHEYGERQYAAEDLPRPCLGFHGTLDDVQPESWGGTSWICK